MPLILELAKRIDIVNNIDSKVITLSQIFRNVQVIGFDLDDTLWNNRTVIKDAIDAQFRYLEEQLPNIARAEIETIFTVRVEELVIDDPIRYQDVSLLRMHALEEVCAHFKLSKDHSQQAYDKFFSARQNIELFPKAEPLLKLLNSKMRLVAISNGNATLDSTGIEQYFEFYWRAGAHGLAKPNKDMLIKTCRHFSIDPAQLLYVGDHVKYDYQAASNAGAHSVIISGQSYPDYQDSEFLQFSNLNDFYQASKMCFDQ